MATLNKKVKLYLEANSKVYKDEKVNFELQDDYVDNVSSPYIKTWNVSGLTQPTAEQIANYETAGNTAETLDGVLNTRRAEYLDFNIQLDKLYHDIDDDKLDKNGSWYKHIKKVKDDNPKS